LNYPGEFDVNLPVGGKLPDDGLGAHSDASLLFNGDFERSGVELIHSRDDHELVLQDDFRGEKRAALSSPDGAYLTGNIVNALTGHVEYAQAGGAPDAAEVIGYIQTAIGSGTLTRACDIAVQAKVGEPVCQGDVIETAADARVGLRFIDGTGFNLSGGARMVLDEFVCDSSGTSHSALFGVTRGTFAFTVGQVAKTGCLRIDTPVGSIRGRARTGGIGMLSLTALIFSVMKEVQAAEFSSQRPLSDSLDDDNINPKDLQLNGVVELFMKDGRHYSLDDPLQTVVVGGNGSISVVTNSATRMAELQKYQQDALASYALGTVTGPTSTGGGGSSTPPSLLLSPQGLQPINFEQPAPQNSPSVTTLPAIVSPAIILDSLAPPKPSAPPVLTLAVITPAVGNSTVNTADTLNAHGASVGLTINGTTSGVENGQTVTVSIVNSSGVAVETFTTTVAHNAWSVNVSPTNAHGLSDGSYSVTANVKNAAGIAAPQASQNLTVDQTPPAAPGVALTTDSGISNSDHITNNGAVTLAGIEIGATVEYSTNGGTTWTTSFTPVEGFNTVLVRQTDAAGNVSGASVLDFTRDITPPAVTFDAVSFTGTGVQGAHITDNGKVMLSGTVSDNVTVSQVQVFNGSQLLGTATVDNVHHTWTLTTTLAPGAYNQFNATAIDEAGNPAHATTTQTVQVNDAPVLTPISPTLTAITEDQTTNPGQTVSSFIGASISDVDAGAVKGIAITGLTSTNGTWHYSTDGGTTWTAIGAVSDTTALLLDASDKIRFSPDGNNGGTDTITYRAWDETAGTHGTTADTSTNGGTKAFSTATDTAHLTVTSVNDAPTVAAALSDKVSEGDAAFTHDLLSGASDVDDGETATLQVASLTYVVDGGDASATAPAGVSLGADGHTLSVDPTDPAFDHLAVGECTTIVVSYDVTDVHGATVPQTETITITGTNDAPIAVADVNTGAPVVEKGVNPGNTPFAGVDSATGNVLTNDSDVDTGDTKTVQGVVHGTSSGPLIAYVATPVGGTYGSVTIAADGTWTYTLDNGNPATQALTQGQHVSDVFTYTMDDAHGATSSATLTIDITGSNDAPTLTDVNAGTLTDTAANDHGFGNLTGTLVGVDPDSGETATLSYAAAPNHPVTTAVAGLYGSLTVDANGHYSYVADAAAINALHAGTYADTFTVQTKDVEGAIGTATLTVDVTGANDTPSIVGEADAPTQAVMVVDWNSPIVLAPGLNANSLGLPSETFDNQPAGLMSNSGAGFGDFYSALLDATFSGSGNAGVVNGSFAPFATIQFGPLPGTQDATNYLVVGTSSTETITFTSEKNAFGLYWGTLDAHNEIDFYHGADLVASYTGADLEPLFSGGNRGNLGSDGYVEFLGLAPFDKVVLSGGFFESDNISAGTISVPHAQLSAVISGSLSVHDADIGDTLTASVISNAKLDYNGFTAVPGGIDISALIDAGDVAFDSVLSDGGTDVLHWTYHPTEANLDFLHAGDVLKIEFTAEVSDGHGNVGSQPLTVTLVGANNATNISTFSSVNGSSGNDTFSNVGGNVTIFGGAGQDTFVFNAGFGKATIADFDVAKDTINISHTLFGRIDDILAAATSANSGHDTVITDSSHDVITLSGMMVSQLHASNFILI
jgi:VCBS repeat-containing protein